MRRPMTRSPWGCACPHLDDCTCAIECDGCRFEFTSAELRTVGDSDTVLCEQCYAAAEQRGGAEEPPPPAS